MYVYVIQSIYNKSEPKIFLKNLHFSPNSRKVKVRLFIFVPEKDRLYFQHCQSQSIYFQKVPAPPPLPKNQMTVPLDNFSSGYIKEKN